jgi:hypothetical protein
MTLKDQILSDLDDVFYNTDDFGESVTYTPEGEVGAATIIIPMAADPTLSDPDILADMTTIRIRMSFFDAYGGIEPGRGDTILWNGVTYYVTNKVGGDPQSGEWTLEITRSTRRVIA